MTVKEGRRMGESSRIALVAFFVLCFASQARSNGPSDHRYKTQDLVPFYANKVGPFSRPSETYPYYSLAFCVPDHVEKKKESLGEVLNGDRLVSAPYKLEFLVNKDSEIVCKKKLTREEVSQFRTSILQDYYTQMYYDDLPVYTFLGKVERDYDTIPVKYRYMLYTDVAFEILYNKDRIIEINARTIPDSFVNVTEDKEVMVTFMYSVKWKQTDFSFEERMDKYSYVSSLPHHMEMHWFSVMNSCVTVLVLVGCLVIFYFRKLKKDFNKFSDDEEFGENQEETGWKNIHGDVFRYPKHTSLFAAVVGSGTQLLVLMLSIIGLGVLGVFKPYSRGALSTGLVVIYTITSAVAGFIAVSFHSQFEGTSWVKNSLLTGVVFCGPLFTVFCILNTIAATYGATAALPIGTIFVLLCIYIYGALPLLLLGGIAGKNSAFSKFEAPCPTKKIPREIPTYRWYKGVLTQMVLAGILPFGVIYVELYYVFASIWGHRIYGVYLILLIVAVLLVLVTASVTVPLTHFQLASENHEWWWRSFLYGGSTGLYLFGYSIYYYYERSEMSGLMQTSFFFGYMACLSYGLFLMLGTVGFFASLLFVRHIYGSIKCE